ncbi:MAG: CcmD family protein [Candidatus Zixiibacteriota bacterium]|nr:MAG: CcmD family protein [candidate division Zixibacteria bacterium]
MNANYVVMIVTLIVWAGIFLYVYSLDKKVKRLSKGNEN